MEKTDSKKNTNSKKNAPPQKNQNHEKNKETNSNVVTPASPPEDVHFGDGVPNAFKTKCNETMTYLIGVAFDTMRDEMCKHITDSPEAIKKYLNNPEAKREISDLLSKQMYEKGLVPVVYSGLPDSLLIHNLHQDGYNDGLFAGYAISMMALADNGVSKDIIVTAEKAILPNLVKRLYEDSDEIYQIYQIEHRKWIEELQSEKPDDANIEDTNDNV
ncbi:MAG: hypothetical protein IJT94_17700 [Oscillibacter sp.]|nr:hypothetical protein [Oscillibacter sp.]